MPAGIETEKRGHIKDREYTYRLIISQLFYDGYQNIAVNLSQAVNAYPSCPPSEKLFNLISLALSMDDEARGGPDRFGDNVAPAQNLDLEYEADVTVTTPEPALYDAVYVTTHKGPCRAAAMNADGTLVATGSADASIKVMDMERILQRTQLPPEALQSEQLQAEMHPVIRTLYDHLEEVLCLAFHPREQILASGSRDFSVKFFDYSKSSVKRAFKTITETEPIRSISFHPTGDFLLVGTFHPIIRLYDVNTLQCFVSPVPADQHRGVITDINYTDTGKTYVTASKDGDIKLWDGVSNRCTNTFSRAHEGVEVCSARFTKNGKYVLSSGKDSLVKLWELTTNRCLIAYTGAGLTGRQERRVQSVFNHTEDYVLFPDEKSGSLCAWDARNADRKRLVPMGHNGPVRCIIHSPTQAAFVTCSEDFRARFWFKKTELD